MHDWLLNIPGEINEHSVREAAVPSLPPDLLMSEISDPAMDAIARGRPGYPCRRPRIYDLPTAGLCRAGSGRDEVLRRISIKRRRIAAGGAGLHQFRISHSNSASISTARKGGRGQRHYQLCSWPHDCLF